MKTTALRKLKRSELYRRAAALADAQEHIDAWLRAFPEAYFTAANSGEQVAIINLGRGMDAESAEMLGLSAS